MTIEKLCTVPIISRVFLVELYHSPWDHVKWEEY